MAQINIDHLAKMASEIASTFPQDNTKKPTRERPSLSRASPEDVDQIMMVNSSGTVLSRQQSSPELPTFEESVDLAKNIHITNVFQPDVYTFYGYSLPKNTLYLIIVLIIVGIIVWYISSSAQKKKEKKLIDDEEN